MSLVFLLLWCFSLVAGTEEVTDHFAVELHPKANPQEIAEAHGHE